MTAAEFLKEFLEAAQEAIERWRVSTLTREVSSNRIAGLREAIEIANGINVSSQPKPEPSRLETSIPVLAITTPGGVEVRLEMTPFLAEWVTKHVDPIRLVALLVKNPDTHRALVTLLGFDEVYERTQALVEKLSVVDEAYVAARFGAPPEDIGDIRAWYRRLLMAQLGLKDPR